MMDHTGVMKRHGGRCGKKPITVKSGPYTMTTVGHLEAMLPGLFQSCMDGMLTCVVNKLDPDEKIRSLHVQLCHWMCIKCKESSLLEFKMVWEPSVLAWACVTVEIDIVETTKRDVQSFRYSLESVGQYTGFDRVWTRVFPLAGLMRFTYCRCLRKHLQCHFLQIELNN